MRVPAQGPDPLKSSFLHWLCQLFQQGKCAWEMQPIFAQDLEYSDDISHVWLSNVLIKIQRFF